MYEIKRGAPFGAIPANVSESDVDHCVKGDAENAARELLQDMKMTDQVARHENAGYENAGHENAGHENTRHENAGHENDGPSSKA